MPASSCNSRRPHWRPSCRSSRVAGCAADEALAAGIKYETRDGGVVLNAAGGGWGRCWGRASARSELQRAPPVPLPLALLLRAALATTPQLSAPAAPAAPAAIAILAATPGHSGAPEPYPPPPTTTTTAPPQPCPAPALASAPRATPTPSPSSLTTRRQRQTRPSWTCCAGRRCRARSVARAAAAARGPGGARRARAAAAAAAPPAANRWSRWASERRTWPRWGGRAGGAGGGARWRGGGGLVRVGCWARVVAGRGSGGAAAQVQQLPGPAPASAWPVPSSLRLSCHRRCQRASSPRPPPQVTNNGITCLQFLPTSSALLVAAGDKSGNVGFWHVDRDNGGPEDDFDGVLQTNPHQQYVSGLRWTGSGGAARLFTGSYDATVRCLDLGSGAGMSWEGVGEGWVGGRWACASAADAGRAAGRAGHRASGARLTRSPSPFGVGVWQRQGVPVAGPAWAAACCPASTALLPATTPLLLGGSRLAQLQPPPPTPPRPPPPPDPPNPRAHPPLRRHLPVRGRAAGRL
jgi:hypothetical protein